MEPQNWGSADIMWLYYHNAFPCCKWTFSVSFSDSRALLGTSPRSSSGVRFMTCTTTRASRTNKTTQTTSFWIWHVCIIPISMADLLVRLLMTHLLNHSWIERLLWSWIVMNRSVQNDLRQCIFQWERIDHNDIDFSHLSIPQGPPTIMTLRSKVDKASLKKMMMTSGPRRAAISEHGTTLK